MKIKKFLLTMCLILCFGLILVSCTSNNVSLEFLITPDEIIIHSNNQLMALNKIEDKTKDFIKSCNEKYDDSTKMSEEDMKKAEEIQNKLLDTINSGRKIENKITIEDIFNQLRELEGVYVDSFEEDVIVRIDLIEDSKTESVVSLENAYLRTLILLEDGNMIIPKGIMSKSETGLEPTGKLEYIKVKLPEELKFELEELAKD
ncbi:hypothetical protein SAMN02745784_03126 [Tissierella praeacuta DSM 18095]|uniref:DUF5105 domain-containing protein n=1 Tax=Tissierella praeacuta DSM 18095 TaxID=1123404 RepID=A0A1M4ZNI6_9FIRM|nr:MULTISPECIES: hypothetical protein [Tissierella]SHF19362.1 hypothetical protein SAMN02745784_03126 [Tissierella praeacuta DSM 18095]SUP02250.1 Uncharacterised protein [Tissierella praeacuta]